MVKYYSSSERSGDRMISTFFSIAIIGMILLFFTSLFVFVRRLLSNSSIRKEADIQNTEKLHLIIGQNKEIISLLKNDKQI